MVLSTTKPTGWKATDFTLKGIDGKTYSLADVRGPKGTVAAFICNHCPYVKASIDRFHRVTRCRKAKGSQQSAGRGVLFADLNSAKFCLISKMRGGIYLICMERHRFLTSSQNAVPTYCVQRELVPIPESVQGPATRQIAQSEPAAFIGAVWQDGC
jgi:hypothetical protein